MDETLFKKFLSDLPLGEIWYFPSIGSTNDFALAQATEGAPDMSLVFANEQTAGRGRGSRRWVTPPDSALALSLILRPRKKELEFPALISGLAALSLVSALRDQLGLQAQIKWPNDVLLNGSKVAGVLVENVWLGDRAESFVVGLGVNVDRASVPDEGLLNFPATSIEQAAGRRIDRFDLLKAILHSLIAWREQVGTDTFTDSWNNALAYRGESVQVWVEGSEPRTGFVVGVGLDGSLKLQSPDHSSIFEVQYGEVRLRLKKGL